MIYFENCRAFQCLGYKNKKFKIKIRDIHQSNYGKPLILMFIGKYDIFHLISPVLYCQYQHTDSDAGK